MIRRALPLLAAALLLAGCPAQSDCHPGDVQASHGHVRTCGTDKRWHGR